MNLLLISLVIVGLCVFLLSFNVIFRKNGKFPEKEIEKNKDLSKLGINCAKSDERKMWGVNKDNSCCSDCSNCSSLKI